MLKLPAFALSRVPNTVQAGLTEALDDVRRWTSSLPKESLFYVNQEVTVRRPQDLPPDVPKSAEIMLADVFFDVHSIFANLCLVKSWRLDQLADGLVASLASWNLTVAAPVARSLVETAAAFAVETRELNGVWAATKARPASTPPEAMGLRKELFEGSIQMGWGTRLPAITKGSPRLQRKNVLTLLKKATSILGCESLERDYDTLCDAVHPSWGSNECFWSESGLADNKLPQMRVLLSRQALGWLAHGDDEVKPGSPLSEVIFRTSELELRTIVSDLRSFDRLCRDLCLTARVYRLGDIKYWGVVQPTGPYDQCSCGSGSKTKFCRHEFGDGGPLT
jgi:hypothetical protein